MAIIKTEGFDLIGVAGDLVDRGFDFGEGTVVPTASKWNTPVVDLGNSNGTVVSYTLPLAPTVEEYMSISVWKYLSAQPVSTVAFFIAISGLPNSSNPSTADVHCGLALAGSGGLTVYDNIGIVEVISDVLQVGVWQHHEFRTRIHSSLGTIEYWVDGLKLVDLTARNTARNTTGISVILPGTTPVTNNYIDDLVIQQGTTIQPQIGAHRIHTLLPDGAGTNSAWTGTFADVDDPFGASDGDTTFAVATTLNAKQDYSVGNLTQSPTTIHAVALTSEMRKTDAGTKAATPYILSNAVIGTGAVHGTSEAYTTGVDLFVLNPDGAIAWTETSVNALLIGHEVTT